MKPFLYSLDPRARVSQAQAFIDDCERTIHLHPRGAALSLKGAVFGFAYEDIGKTDVWLSIHSLVGDGCGLLLQDPARYPSPTTEKSRMIRRLSMSFPVERKLIVDIVPFTEGPESLYTCVSYIDRGILGYAHNYAWRANYDEECEDGQVRRAHDPKTIAPKLAPWCQIDYAALEVPSRLVAFSETDEELEVYRKRRDHLFNTERNPGRIITRLADTAHAFNSRRQALLRVLPEVPDTHVIVTNLASEALSVRALIKEAGFRHRCTSYAKLPGWPVDGVVYLEAPIVGAHRRLDLESRIGEGGRSTWLLGTTGVDRHLHGETQREIKVIDALVKELRHEQ